MTYLDKSYQQFRLGWRRSKRGNYWKKDGASLLTIFPRGRGWAFSELIESELLERELNFSPAIYNTVEAAKEGCWEFLYQGLTASG